MHNQDDFLSPFSQRNVASDTTTSCAARRPLSLSPVRAPSSLSSPAPTLYSMVSDAGLYAAPYPAAFPPAAATPTYGYGAWRPQRSNDDGESRVRAANAVSAAEKQRQVLKMEVDLVEEQRRRLEARMAAARQAHAMRPDTERAVSLLATHTASVLAEDEKKDDDDDGDGERGRARSMAEVTEQRTREATPRCDMSIPAPPPCSPSPPSVHVHDAPKRSSDPLTAAEPQLLASPPRPELSQAATFTHEQSEHEDAAHTAAVHDASGLRGRISPTPSPSLMRVEEVEEEEDKRHVPLLPQSFSAPRQLRRSLRSLGTTSTTSKSPSKRLVSFDRNTRAASAWADRREERGGGRAPSPLLNAAKEAAAEEEEEGEEEERLYAAYQRNLARIQEALRQSSRTATADGVASVEAQLAYQQRRRVSTPRPPRSSPSGQLKRPAMPPMLGAPSPLSFSAATSSPTLRRAGEAHDRAPSQQPLVRRAPSLGSTLAPALPGSPPRQLRWDLAHSGNIAVSADGYGCCADAADAIALIEEEYADRLMDVLPRLVIPFYAMGTIGTTQGSLVFCFRWVSAEGARGRGRGRTSSAMAFGFATHEFTGYGTEAPAFLYLSTGAIAQGLRASSNTFGQGSERAYGAPFQPGVELAARLDMRRGELEFFVESVSMGVAFRFCPARHPAPLYPVVVFSAERDVAELLYSA